MCNFCRIPAVWQDLVLVYEKIPLVTNLTCNPCSYCLSLSRLGFPSQIGTKLKKKELFLYPRV